MKIRKGDRVQVLAGKDRGKVGEVITALPKENKLFVDGVNVAKRHTKPRGQNQPGGIIDKIMPIDISNVAIVCKTCGKPTRIGTIVADDGEKSRFCRKCEAIL